MHFVIVHYEPFDKAVHMHLGQDVGCWVVKVDLQSTFQYLSIANEDMSLLSCTAQVLYFIDTQVPLGALPLCAIFEIFSKVLK